MLGAYIVAILHIYLIQFSNNNSGIIIFVITVYNLQFTNKTTNISQFYSYAYRKTYFRIFYSNFIKSTWNKQCYLKVTDLDADLKIISLEIKINM